ncbi:hypothetical protein FWD07_02975 [Candidatus Saccharibacteria bacterium]|nr:hypothetical protein [Candidatus Saccharibacteria bacterium]
MHDRNPELEPGLKSAERDSSAEHLTDPTKVYRKNSGEYFVRIDDAEIPATIEMGVNMTPEVTYELDGELITESAIIEQEYSYGNFSNSEQLNDPDTIDPIDRQFGMDAINVDLDSLDGEGLSSQESANALNDHTNAAVTKISAATISNNSIEEARTDAAHLIANTHDAMRSATRELDPNASRILQEQADTVVSETMQRVSTAESTTDVREAVAETFVGNQENAQLSSLTDQLSVDPSTRNLDRIVGKKVDTVPEILAAANVVAASRERLKQRADSSLEDTEDVLTELDLDPEFDDPESKSSYLDLLDAA